MNTDIMFYICFLFLQTTTVEVDKKHRKFRSKPWIDKDEMNTLRIIDVKSCTFLSLTSKYLKYFIIFWN